MKKYFKGATSALLSIMLAALTGCQSLPGSPGLGSFINPSPTSNNITSSVQAAFDNEPVLRGIPIKIEARNETVRLSGYVKTIRQSDMAAFIASKVNGVKVVDNNLIVRK